MNIFEAILFVAGMIAIVVHYWTKLVADDEEHDRRWLAKWTIAGIALPALAWVMMNVGNRPVMPALIPVMPPAKGGASGQWVFGLSYIATQTAPALCVISSFWAALTLGWMAMVGSRRMGAGTGFTRASVTWCSLFIICMALLVYARCLPALGICALLWVWPLAHYAVYLRPLAPAPMYASAIAKMKFGKYREAERAILSELEKCETDFDGWLMLASLYARQFHDLPEAERTIHDLCNDPAITASQVAVALNLLADWQLQFRGDPDAARRALDEISQRLPGSHMAKMAVLRKGQLPADAAAWKEQQQPKTIQLLPLSEQLDHGEKGGAEKVDRDAAMALVNQCTEKLRCDPNDVEIREQLAKTLAEQLGKTDLAVEQLHSLMEMPGQPRSKIVEWLAMMASWEIARGGNPDAIRGYLARIIREFPESAHAFAAQRRLSLLDMESRITRARAVGDSQVAKDQSR